VNKADLIEHMALHADISKASAQRALEAFIGGVSSALQAGDTVSLTGFGSFSVSSRTERTGLNPKTREPMTIKAAKAAKFKAGKGLRDAIQ
jgi:DNA-binding protein HU-beta